MGTAEHMYVFEISVHTSVYLVTESWIATSTYVDQLTRENCKINKITVLLLQPRWPLKVKTYEKNVPVASGKLCPKPEPKGPKNDGRRFPMSYSGRLSDMDLQNYKIDQN